MEGRTSLAVAVRHKVHMAQVERNDTTSSATRGWVPSDLHHGDSWPWILVRASLRHPEPLSLFAAYLDGSEPATITNFRQQPATGRHRALQRTQRPTRCASWPGSCKRPPNTESTFCSTGHPAAKNTSRRPAPIHHQRFAPKFDSCVHKHTTWMPQVKLCCPSHRPGGFGACRRRSVVSIVARCVWVAWDHPHMAGSASLAEAVATWHVSALQDGLAYRPGGSMA